MNGVKRNWILAGGLLLSTAAEMPLFAEELAPTLPASIANSPTVGPGGAIVPVPEAERPFASELYYPEPPPYCYPRQSAIERWRRRCRARAQDKCLGYPEEYQDAPLGMMVQSHIAVSVANGHAARMVLHQYDFYPSSDQLKPRGKAQLAKIASWLPMNAFPVFVEPTIDVPELDEARRQTVLRELAEGACLVPSERILVGVPAGRGLNGLEAVVIDRNRGLQTLNRGVGAAGGGAAGGSSIRAN